MTERRYFTEEEKNFFKEYSYGHSRKETQQEFYNRFGEMLTLNQVIRQIKKAGGTGRTGYFEKGNEHVYKASKRNLEEQITKDGKSGYEVKIKVDGAWVRKNRYIWEQKYGPIPDDKCLIYKDGDKLNCCIDNLMLIDKSVSILMSRNHFHSAKGQIREVCINIAKLEDAIRSK